MESPTDSLAVAEDQIRSPGSGICPDALVPELNLGQVPGPGNIDDQAHAELIPMRTPAVPALPVEDVFTTFVVGGVSIEIPRSVVAGDILRLRRYLAVALPGRLETAKIPEAVAAVRRNLIRKDQYLATRRRAPSTRRAGKAIPQKTDAQTALLRSLKTLLRRLEAELAPESGNCHDDGAEPDEVGAAS